MRRKIPSLLALASAVAAVAAAPAWAVGPVHLGTSGKPTLDVDAVGTAHVAWPASTPAFNGVHYCRVPRGSEDVGCPHGVPFTIAAASSPSSLAHVMIDANNFVHVAYRKSGADEVVARTSTNGGVTFGGEDLLATTPTVDMDISSDATLIWDGAKFGATWVSGAQTGGSDAQTAIFADAGTTTTFANLFAGGSSSQAAVADTATFPATSRPLVVSDKGPGQLKYQVYDGSGSVNDAANWGFEQSVPNNGTAQRPALAAGPRGVFLAYSDRGSTGAPNGLWVRRWNGAGFDAPVQVAPSGADRLDLDQDGSGRLHLVWTRAGFETLWSTSTDGGATWSAPVKIIPASASPLSLKVAAAPDGQGWAAYQELSGDVNVVPLEPIDDGSVSPPSPPPTPPSPPPGGAGGGGSENEPGAPAKLRVLRAEVRRGRLDVLAQITRRATGKLKVAYRSAGRTTRFEVELGERSRRARSAQAGGGQLVRIDRRLTGAQRRTTTGIVRISYDGDDRVREDSVRLRAARNPARLRRTTTRIDSRGRLVVGGTISRRARGVVRIRMDYVTAGGEVEELRFRARIRVPRRGDARWRIVEELPSRARQVGGQLSIQYTGYGPRHIRGEQTSKQVRPAEED